MLYLTITPENRDGLFGYEPERLWISPQSPRVNRGWGIATNAAPDHVEKFIRAYVRLTPKGKV